MWFVLVSVDVLPATKCTALLYVCTDEPLKDVSLDKFLARNTSEDNVSFSEIMVEAEKKRWLKHAWLYEKVDVQLEVSVVMGLSGCLAASHSR